MEMRSVVKDAFDIPPDAEHRLSAFMGRVRSGVKSDFRTKIWGGLDRGQVLKDLERISLPTGVTAFDEVEKSAIGKFGSFSIRLPYSEVSDRVDAYFRPKKFDIPAEVLRQAVLFVRKLLPENSLNATSLVTSFASSPKGTNWGLPFFSSDSKYYPYYLKRANIIRNNGWKFGGYYPCVLGVRSQPNGIGEPAKWRPLHMADHVIIGTELAIQIPLLDALRPLPEFVAWRTPNDIARRVTVMLNSQGGPWISSDFSSYDANLPEELIRAAFDLMRYWFTGRNQKHIDWIEEAFLHVPLLTPDGLRVGRRGAVPSGLGMTNMVDTLAQILVDTIIAIVEDTTVEGIYLGDDGVKRFTKEITPELYSYWCGRMNLTVSVDKSMYSKTEVDFLQRRHSVKYALNGLNVGFRSQIRTGNGVISTEISKHYVGAILSIRGIQQVEQASDDPRFREFVRWLYYGDPYLQQHGPHGLIAEAGGVERAKQLLKYRSFPYNQRDISEFSQFRTVQILEEIRTGTKAVA